MYFFKILFSAAATSWEATSALSPPPTEPAANGWTWEGLETTNSLRSDALLIEDYIKTV